ncbi:MAG: hypothetical protein GEU90_09650 [Gemmatimonas sp.]|nr:hypothetical protein [Gemmatimonas sp.]
MSGLGKVALTAALTAAVTLGTSELAAQDPTAAGSPITIELSAEGAGQVGSATLTPAGEQTQVAVEVAGAPADAALSAYLVSGACAESGDVIAELGTLESGSLTSEVPIDLATIASTAVAVEVRQEDTALACGESAGMEDAGAPPVDDPAPSDDPAPPSDDPTAPSDDPPVPPQR